MATAKEDAAAAAMTAQQLGSMSLDGSTETKDNGTETTQKNEAPVKFCSACGKKSNTLKKCTACKCVWYCDRDCQSDHRKEHKTECKLIKKELDKRGSKLVLGTELDVGPLGEVPPREECPICMQVLPIHEKLHAYNTCCGKILCGGCDFQHQIKSEGWPTCAFCRSKIPRSDEKKLMLLRKRVDSTDPNALCTLAMSYGDGYYGLPVDEAKCIDLLRQSADLGCPSAQFNLGNFYNDGEMGLQQNEEEAIKYFKEAAEGGHVLARNHLGCIEVNRGSRNRDIIAAMRHWRSSASGGYSLAMGRLIVCFEPGLLHHGDLAETLQAFYRARAEMKSKDREQFIEYLKRTGEYETGYDS